jgi:hypothetical protein
MNARMRTIGLVLVAIGAVVFVNNSGILGVLPAFIWVSLLFALGAGFWINSRNHLLPWQRILGFTIIGVIATSTSGDLGGAAATGFVGMAFALVYLAAPGPERWWALIPMGVLGSVTLLILGDELFPRWDATPLLFLGFAATFTLLYLMPRERGGRRWALYPAIFWIVMTVVVNDPGSNAPGWLLPLLLIAGGISILYWWRRGNRGK